MSGPTYVTHIDQVIMVHVDSFQLVTGRHLNPSTGQALSTPLLILRVSSHGDVKFPHPDINLVFVHFTDQPHPNVGQIDGVTLDLYVHIVETQTWWQLLSNGRSTLSADVNNTLGVVGVLLWNEEVATDKDPAEQLAAVRELLRRPANVPA